MYDFFLDLALCFLDFLGFLDFWGPRSPAGALQLAPLLEIQISWFFLMYDFFLDLALCFLDFLGFLDFWGPRSPAGALQLAPSRLTCLTTV